VLLPDDVVIHTCRSGTSQIRQIMGNPDLYRDKIEGKQFLLGRFEITLNKKQAKKVKRPRKIASIGLFEIESRFREMLVKQAKPFGQNPMTYDAIAPLNRLWNSYMNELIESEYSIG
jgi:hypothetical protein